MAFSLFGKKDEPDKKNQPPAKKAPVAGTPAARPGAPAPAKGTVTPPPPKPVGGAAAKPAPKSSAPQESKPVDDDDLDFTALTTVAPSPAPKPVMPTPGAKAATPPAQAPPKPGAAPSPDLFADLAAKIAPQAGAKPAAPPAAKATPAPAAKPAAAPAARQETPPAADLAPLDPGTLGTAKGAAPAFEKTWMPEGRNLAPEKAAPTKAPAKAEPVSRPRGTASAGPSAPPTLGSAPPAKAAAPPAAEAKKPAPAPAAAPAAAPAKPAPQPAVAAAPKAAPAAAEPEIALPEPIEKAAVLYANGQTDAAVMALKSAIAAGKLGDAAAQAWLMLFDLYQSQGRKDLHEALAPEFVVKFERSAPAWRDEPKENEKDPAMQRGAGSHFALSGELTAASAGEIGELQKAAEKGQLLRIEFGKMKAVDAQGAKLLLDALKNLQKSRRELVLSNHKTLVDLLAALTEVGRKEDPQDYWLLLLELNQVLGLQEAFDEVALNFAITYELSPPAFEERAKPAKAEAAADSLEAGDDAIVMTGEICGSDDDELARLAKAAAARNDVVIDMARLKRVDSKAAAAMLETVTGLAAAGKSVRIRAANELISALFQVVGIARYVKLIKRR